jgi:hypothetical protein
MKVAYVAGPFRDKPGVVRAYSFWNQDQNVNRAAEIALKIWAMGASVICPHLNTRPFQGALHDEVWLEGDLEQIRRCDYVVMIPGWRESVGSQNEFKFALGLGKRVFIWSGADAHEYEGEGTQLRGATMLSQVLNNRAGG